MKGMENTESQAGRDVLDELFQHATARERPPTAAEQAIRESLHSEWRQMAARRRTRRIRSYWAAAASLAAAAVAVTLLWRAPAPAGPAVWVATSGKVQGAVLVRDSEKGTAEFLEAAQSLDAGQTLAAGHGSRFALRWRNGISLRVDQNSEIQLVSPAEFRLIHGRVYVETGTPGDADTRLSLLTPVGPLEHLGTRYLASVKAGTTSVSVRDGKVIFVSRQSLASAGEKLSISKSGREMREPVAPYGGPWEWTEQLAPAFVSGDRPVSEFLAWVGHETGRRIEFDSFETEQLAAATRLRGDVDLGPMEALESVLLTTDFEFSLSEDTILLSTAAGR